MRKLKLFDLDFDLFFGLKNRVKTCCIIFYECVWLTGIRPTFYHEYNTQKITYENGIILCPECILKAVKK